MRNIANSGTPLERAALTFLRERLPAGWSAVMRRRGRARELIIEAPDRRRVVLDVKSKMRLSPRDVPYLLGQGDGDRGRLLVIAPFVSQRAREILVAAGASYADATGNMRVVSSDPGLFVESRGDDRAPDGEPRALRSLKGPAAGRVVRALADFSPPYGVRRLADLCASPLGTVSRVVSFLEEEALLTRGESKRIASVDWAALIARWARDYGVATSNRMGSFIEPRGLSALAPKLGRLGRYAVTGSLAGTGVAPARLAMIYVDDADRSAVELDLEPTDAGTNVWLLEPFDDVVFDRTREVRFGDTTVVAAAPSQVATDLLTSPGRGPQEGAALIERMKETEDDWRRAPGR